MSQTRPRSSLRSKAHRISIFNHKGGVGKTTMTMNIACALADRGKRVLLVDSDPQCNLTSYLVEDSVVDDLLDNSDKDVGKTLWTSLKPVSEATGDPRPVEPIELSHENLFLLPGDIRLSEFEADLTEFWAQCFQRKLKGFRGTSALSEIVNSISKRLKIDYIFYDSGPNIGALNRTILLDCDYFIIALACDLFSLRALKTLGITLVNWIKDWSTIVEIAPQDIYLVPGKPKFMGYIPERFRVYGGRIASEHSRFLSRIEREVHSQIVVRLRNIDPELTPRSPKEIKLGEVKDYGGLIQMSQRQGLPIYDVKGGAEYQQTEARASFHAIAENIDSFLEST